MFQRTHCCWPIHPMLLPCPVPPISFPPHSSISTLLSLWFLTSLSPVLHLVSISPSFLPKLTAQPCFLLAFCLALSPFPFLSPYSPYPPSPEGVDWHCDVMMSHQHSSVSVDNCQLGQTQRNLLHFQAPEKAMEVPCGQLPCIGIHYFLFFFLKY